MNKINFLLSAHIFLFFGAYCAEPQVIQKEDQKQVTAKKGSFTIQKAQCLAKALGLASVQAISLFCAGLLMRSAIATYQDDHVAAVISQGLVDPNNPNDETLLVAQRNNKLRWVYYIIPKTLAAICCLYPSFRLRLPQTTLENFKKCH